MRPVELNVSKLRTNECLSTRISQPASLAVPFPLFLPFPSMAFGFERVLQLQSRVPLPSPSSLCLSLSPHDPLMKAAAAPSPIGRRRAPRGRGHALPLAGGGEEDAGAREAEEERREESAPSRGCSPPPGLLQSRNIALPKGHPYLRNIL